jgi:hypothetical protein
MQKTLDVITVGTGARYINVDMASPSGILRAKRINLGSSGLVDAISTPFLFETANIFKGIHETGKCFTLLRHPVDRAISMYHHYKIVENGNSIAAQYGGLTIDEFAGTFGGSTECLARTSPKYPPAPTAQQFDLFFTTILFRLVCRE